MVHDIKDPIVIDKVFSDEDFSMLHSYLFNKDKTQHYFDTGFGRYSFQDDVVDLYHQKSLELAREVFNSPTLLPSYALFAHYEGPNARLWRHKDDNACTYTIDLCVYQNQPWDLWIEDKPYTLHENQAATIYGNDQWHWREAFPNPDSQYVANIFFHYVEPDHWFFTKGASYLDVVRGIISEGEWNARHLSQ